MSQYSFAEASGSIFEMNTQPRLSYLQAIQGNQPALPKALHAHQDTAEIVFMRAGSNKCTVDNHSYTIETGDIIFLNIGVLHSFFEPPVSADCSSFLLGISGLHLRGLEKGHLIDAKLCPVLKTGQHEPLLRQYFELLYQLALKCREHAAANAANHALQALLTTSCELMRSNKLMNGGQDYNLGLRIKEYIDEHYLEELKLADIAEALHVNAYYLSHTFKKILGYSPIQYMIHRRIGEAQNMLINTELTVTEIALRCGYNNSNYFQVVFNTIVGMPPGKYRKAWRV